MSEVVELRELLKAAGLEITDLRGRVDAHVETLEEMHDKETALEKQIILLHSQIGELEDRLEDSDEQLSGTMSVMQAIRDAIAELRKTSLAALEQAKTASSRSELASSVYEMAAKSQLAEEAELIDEYERKIAALRERLKG